MGVFIACAWLEIDFFFKEAKRPAVKLENEVVKEIIFHSIDLLQKSVRCLVSINNLHTRA